MTRPQQDHVTTALSLTSRHHLLLLLMLLLLLTTNPFHVNGQTDLPYYDDSRLSLQQMEDTFKATERALKFLISHYRGLNLDAGLGVRLMQAVYTQLIGLYGVKLPKEMLKKMEQLVSLADEAGALAELNSAIKTPFYYSKNSYLLQPKQWQFLLPTRGLKILPPVSLQDIIENDAIQEDQCDACFREFIPRDSHRGCDISDRCFTYMNWHNHSSYSLTHQVLYYFIGLGARCESQILDMIMRHPTIHSIENQLYEFCSKIYSEARTFEKYGFPKELRDLFLEQVGVCGIAGFEEIARSDWLDIILKWQSPTSGCFHQFIGERMNPENFNPSRYGNYRRRKRSEMMMDGGKSIQEVCLAHRTGVALIALAAYTRRIVEENLDV
ncbi:unnamed protein product [Rodentolepis nana]|uniref:UPF0764 protein C16orf89 homolog n=1 Tax=Rodentolepis nana TaxID=102285 RepID=A0A0R3TRF9_RODNA|nr:unnamed protein product [Rodentolepis nana]